MVEIEDLKKDFSFLNGKVLGILLYGSHAQGENTLRSDVDICIVVGDKKKLTEILRETLRKVDKNYDIKLFEELPLHIKISIIENNRIIYAKNKPELYEYFYFYRKLWEDQKHRQDINKKEIIETLS